MYQNVTVQGAAQIRFKKTVYTTGSFRAQQKECLCILKKVCKWVFSGLKFRPNKQEGEFM